MYCRLSLFLISLSFFGCSANSNSITIDKNMPPEVSEAETGQVADTATENEDTSDIELGEAPYIVSAMGNFEDYPNIGKVIEITVKYLDAQSDLDSGFIHLEYTSDRASGNESFNIDGHDVFDDGEYVTMAFRNANLNLTYSFKVMLEDIEGHLSQKVSFDVFE